MPLPLSMANWCFTVLLYFEKHFAPSKPPSTYSTSTSAKKCAFQLGKIYMLRCKRRRNCWSNTFGVNKSMVNIIHELAADVKDSQKPPAVSYRTFKYHYNEEMDAHYTLIIITSKTWPSACRQIKQRHVAFIVIWQQMKVGKRRNLR